MLCTHYLKTGGMISASFFKFYPFGLWLTCFIRTALLVVLDKIEAIQIHDLVPGRNEITHELLFCITLRIYFGQGS